MKSTYARAMKEIRTFEGGYVNHPKDPGGATNFGITQAVYDAYRREQGMSKQSVRLISEAEVNAIYATKYAAKVRYDDLPAGVDFATLDAAVNSGVSRGGKWLQSSLGVSSDGVVGRQTISAAAAADATKVIKSIYAKRTSFVRGLTIFKTFGKGWLSRFARGEAVAVDMHMQHRGISAASKKIALTVEADNAAANASTAKATATGTGTGAAASATQIDVSNLSGLESMLFIGAAVGLVVLAIYLIHRSRVQKERASAYAAVAAGA